MSPIPSQPLVLTSASLPANPFRQPTLTAHLPRFFFLREPTLAAATGLGTLGCSLHRYALPVVRRPSQLFFFNIHRASSHVCSTRSICSLHCHDASLSGPDNLILRDYMHKHRSDGVSSIVVDQPNLVPLDGTAASSQHIVHRLTVTFGYQKTVAAVVLQLRT